MLGDEDELGCDFSFVAHRFDPPDVPLGVTGNETIIRAGAAHNLPSLQLLGHGLLALTGVVAIAAPNQGENKGNSENHFHGSLLDNYFLRCKRIVVNSQEMISNRKISETLVIISRATGIISPK